MSWAELSRAHRATTPSPEGLDRLSVTLGEPLTLGEALHGGVATSTHALATPTRRLVLKRYRADDETAPNEWERLHAAMRSAVASPEPVALDTDGAWFGCDALVMSRLPGDVAHPPAVDALARALASIHDTDVPLPIDAVLDRPAPYEAWEQVREWPDGLGAALLELRELGPRLPRVFAHADFHPGNVLVTDGEVTGVIDWASARLAPRGLDVALMRSDLAIAPGGDAPERFLDAYERAVGSRVEHLPLFDAFAACRILDHGHGWVDAWTDIGVDVTEAVIVERGTAFAIDALRRLA